MFVNAPMKREKVTVLFKKVKQNKALRFIMMTLIHLNKQTNSPNSLNLTDLHVTEAVNPNHVNNRQVSA